MVSRIYAEMGFALESQEDGFSEFHFKDIEQQHFLNPSLILTNYMHSLPDLIRHAPLN